MSVKDNVYSELKKFIYDHGIIIQAIDFIELHDLVYSFIKASEEKVRQLNNELNKMNVKEYGEKGIREWGNTTYSRRCILNEKS